MKRLLLVILAGVAVAGCPAPPLRGTASTNRDVAVEVMTEFDGIRLYRVDVGSRIVFVAAYANQLSTSWREQQGKTSVEVHTETVAR